MRRSCLLALATAAVLAATSAPAGAVPCANTLTDSAGTAWATSPDRSSLVTPAHAAYGITAVGSSAYIAPDQNGCTLEDGGREIVYPADTPAGTAIEARVKVFVPAAGAPFARHLQILRNPTASAVTADLQFNHSFANDDPATIHSTSNGDATVTPSSDAWVVTTSGTPPVAFAAVWDADFGPKPDPVDQIRGNGAAPFASGHHSLTNRYTNVTLAPGETAIYMHVGLTRGTPDAARQAADQAARGILPVYDGMTPQEISQLQNWPPPPTDADGDDAVVTADNCPEDRNPDQLDTDGDGAGDACDGDDDGDGLGDAVEVAIGSNARSADSDGDGRADGADACPTRAAASADGCPDPPSQAQTPLAAGPDSPAKLALSGFRSKLKLKAFLKGLPITATPDEPVALDFQLTTSLRGARVLLAERSLDRAGGARTVKLKPAKRAIGRSKRLTLRLKVTATDAGGNRTVATRTLKVAP